MYPLRTNNNGIELTMALHTFHKDGKDYHIRVAYDPKPIPLRNCDYMAHVVGYDEEQDPVGWGKTEQEAITNLWLELEIE